jgi:hypothetical protein
VGAPGPSWGRKTAVIYRQRSPADSRNRSSTAVLGRHGAAGPYMACKGSGVQIPSAPPPQHRRSKACPSFSGATCRCRLPDSCHRVPLDADGGVSVRAAAASTSSSRAAAMAASRPSRAGSAARRPRRNAPSDQTAPVPPDLNLPHAQQVVVVQPHTTDLTGSNARTELVHALSSQPAHHASPQQLGPLARAHWQVEALHWGRDVTFAEDASRIRTASGPQVMATLRNLAIGCSAWPVTPRSPHAALGQPESRPRLAFLASHEPANTPNPITPRPWTPRYEDPHQPPTSRDGHLVRYSRAQDGRSLRPREMFSLRRHQGT